MDIVIGNGDLYVVIKVTEYRYSVTKEFFMERLMQGIIDKNWLIHYVDYHVVAKTASEDFTRTFVFTEQEAVRHGLVKKRRGPLVAST